MKLSDLRRFHIPTEYPHGGPLFWMNEETGLLRHVVTGFYRELTSDYVMTPEERRLLRDYFRHWILAPCWDTNPHLDAANRAELAALRAEICGLPLDTTEQLRAWQQRACEIGIDPL